MPGTSPESECVPFSVLVLIELILSIALFDAERLHSDYSSLPLAVSSNTGRLNGSLTA
jgi:hypothetical protein